MRALDQAEVDRAANTFESRGLQGQDELVEEIKQDASVLLARFDRIPVPPGENAREAGRLLSLAKTHLENAVMWAVKAISRG